MIIDSLAASPQDKIDVTGLNSFTTTCQTRVNMHFDDKVVADLILKDELKSAPEIISFKSNYGNIIPQKTGTRGRKPIPKEPKGKKTRGGTGHTIVNMILFTVVVTICRRIAKDKYSRVATRIDATTESIPRSYGIKFSGNGSMIIIGAYDRVTCEDARIPANVVAEYVAKLLGEPIRTVGEITHVATNYKFMYGLNINTELLNKYMCSLFSKQFKMNASDVQAYFISLAHRIELPGDEIYKCFNADSVKPIPLYESDVALLINADIRIELINIHLYLHFIKTKLLLQLTDPMIDSLARLALLPKINRIISDIQARNRNEPGYATPKCSDRLKSVEISFRSQTTGKKIKSKAKIEGSYVLTRIFESGKVNICGMKLAQEAINIYHWLNRFLAENPELLYRNRINVPDSESD